MERLIAKHNMKADDGTEYEVLEYQEFVDATTKDGADWIPGMKHLRLADGSSVNHIDDDTFEIVAWPKVRIYRA